MSKILTNNQYYSEIANIIREQNGTNNTYKPSQMASALKNIFYEEVTGTTPLIFQGIGKNLIDYRINGASGGVGDLITDISDSNYGKYKIPVVLSGKNLWNDTNVSISPSYGDKIIKNNHDYILNEITTENSQVIRLPFELNENETYTLSFDAYADENNTKAMIDGQPDNIYNQNLIADTPVFISSTLTRYSVPLTLLNGNTNIRIYRVPLFDNATTSKIYISNIQLEKSLEATSYEEYIAQTTTTIYTNNSIGENESISLADTNTNIMTIDGTNILTINTTIQPSSIYVKSRHKSIYD